MLDHKYSSTEELHSEMNSLLGDLFGGDAVLLQNIIQRISFSGEKKLREVHQKGYPYDWNDTLGDTGLLIRDIVSDADKILALGKKGLERCITYTKETYQEFDVTTENDTEYSSLKEIPLDLLQRKVKEHAEEKLFKLKDNYIRTTPGKKLAERAHEELELALGKFLAGPPLTLKQAEEKGYIPKGSSTEDEIVQMLKGL